jgi:thioredoxin 2
MGEGIKVVCTHCGTINRVPSERDARGAKCGSCGTRLFAGHPAEVDTAMFERQVQRSELPVVVDVWAPWCGPCLAMAPEFEKTAAAIEPKVRFLKLNSDNEEELSGRLGIRSIPTTLMFKGGREVGRISGAMSASQIASWVRARM